MKQLLLSHLIILIVLCLFAFIVSGCVSGGTLDSVKPTPAPTVAPGTNDSAIVLTVKGNVDKPMEYRLADLKARPLKNITVNFKDNVTANISGFMLNDLLNDSGVKANATNVTFSSDDGYVKTTGLSDIRASADAMIIIGIQLPQCCAIEGENNESLKNVIPEQPFNTWVGKLTTINVQ